MVMLVQAWLKHFVEASIVKLQHLRFRGLTELVWALACWGYTPTKEWLREYFRVTHAKLHEFRPQHLANAILALKKLGCKVSLHMCNHMCDHVHASACVMPMYMVD
jgi:hypothetical protein